MRGIINTFCQFYILCRTIQANELLGVAACIDCSTCSTVDGNACGSLNRSTYSVGTILGKVDRQVLCEILSTKFCVNSFRDITRCWRNFNILCTFILTCNRNCPVRLCGNRSCTCSCYSISLVTRNGMLKYPVISTFNPSFRSTDLNCTSGTFPSTIYNEFEFNIFCNFRTINFCGPNLTFAFSHSSCFTPRIK